MKWYLKGLRHYADFSGRTPRKEFWMFMLINTVFIIAAAVIDHLCGLDFGIFGDTFNGVKLRFLSGDMFNLTDCGLVTTGYILSTLIPVLAILVRRAHDIGKSGWLYLVAVIPVVGIIIVWFCTDSEPAGNKWGPNPKKTGL